MAFRDNGSEVARAMERFPETVPELREYRAMDADASFRSVARLRWLPSILLAALLCCGAPIISLAQTNFQWLRSFGFPHLSGTMPNATPIVGRDGALYGTTYSGGRHNQGTVFGLTAEGTGYRVLHDFAGGNDDGSNPMAGVVEGSDGVLYGTTRIGGTSDRGTVFRLNKDGSDYSVLRSFTGIGGDGSSPYWGVTEGSDGALYGTTWYGGFTNGVYEFGAGTVFRLNKDGSDYAVLFADSNGDTIRGRLVEGSDGMLYGGGSGTNENGAVFKLNKDGTGLAALRRFTSADDGWPAGLIEGSDGVLYCVTSNGGTNGYGSVFRINKDGGGFAALISFPAVADDRRNQRIDLVEGHDGVLYGTTRIGGFGRRGTVFRLNKDGSGYAVLRSFNDHARDGAWPRPGLVKAGDGALYGTTEAGGRVGGGTLFKLGTDGAGYIALWHFSRSGGDGVNPRPGLTEGTDGFLYGATLYGGSETREVIFKLERDGSGYAVVHRFTNGTTDFRNLNLIVARDRALYGTSGSGGSNGYGAVFKLKADGTGFRVLREFAGWREGDGAWPWAGVLEASDGVLYGTTRCGGYNDRGTVYKINNEGSGYGVLRRFTDGDGDGKEPYGDLLEGDDGLLYGTTASGGGGGISGYGTVFKMNKDGTRYSVLHRFTGGASGGVPRAGLIEGSDGALYGTTEFGGISSRLGNGTLFKINKDGSGFKVVHQFAGGVNGKNPWARVVEKPDGALYGTAVGTTFEDFASDWGTVFKVNKDGSGFAVLHRFARGGGDGRNPYAPLLNASDGVLYGTASAGGDMDLGAVFRVFPNMLPAVTGITLGPAGTQLTLFPVPGQTCRIETSTNLSTSSWQTIGTLSKETAGTVPFTDPNASNYPMRFYRVATP